MRFVEETTDDYRVDDKRTVLKIWASGRTIVREPCKTNVNIARNLWKE